ncbi:uncharacterized protein LOC130675636 [Microplitis mediator]|uniref:uncharacterized protein LOC130672480 n=1 Tax=Microplitis mediator TaxID=375433 RepID=UPI002553685C|nr:uncharacterized protein LOC130672480 [Microplitis mediator]XP_057337410.1 uncharacterized protein LOC130675636 [Microplitis mediator]
MASSSTPGTSSDRSEREEAENLKVLGAVGPNHTRNRKRKLRRWLLETAIELGERPAPPVKRRKLRSAVVVPTSSTLTSSTVSVLEPSPLVESNPPADPKEQDVPTEASINLEPSNSDTDWSLINDLAAVSIWDGIAKPYISDDPYEFYDPAKDRVSKKKRRKDRKRMEPVWELMEEFRPEEPEPFFLSYVARSPGLSHDLIPPEQPDLLRAKPPSNLLSDYKIPKINRFRLPSSVISHTELKDEKCCDGDTKIH